MCVCARVRLEAQSCLTLCNPMGHSLPGSLSMGFSRQEYWRGLPFPSPGDLPNSGITRVCWIAGRFFTTEPQGMPTVYCSISLTLHKMCLLSPNQITIPLREEAAFPTFMTVYLLSTGTSLILSYWFRAVWKSRLWDYFPSVVLIIHC